MDLERPCAIEGLEFQEAGDDVLVHDPRLRKIHVLNRSAAQVLRLCDGSPVDRLVDALMPAEDFDRARVERDVKTVLERFAALGLLNAPA